MSEPELPPPPPPQTPTAYPPNAPFHPERAKSPIHPGCGKPLAIGCGLLLLLMVAGLYVLMTKRQALLQWSIQAMRPEIERRLPDDATTEEKERVKSSFEAAVARAGSEELDVAALQKLQSSFIGIGSKPKLTHEELDQFLDAVEAFGASGAAPAPELKPAAPEATPPDPSPPTTAAPAAAGT